MDYFRNSKGPVERCSRDGGIDMRNVHDCRPRSWFHSRSRRAEYDPRVFFYNENRSINRDEAAFVLLLDVTPLYMEFETDDCVLTKLIERNTAIHRDRGQQITPYADKQPDVLSCQGFDGARGMTIFNCVT